MKCKYTEQHLCTFYLKQKCLVVYKYCIISRLTFSGHIYMLFG